MKYFLYLLICAFSCCCAMRTDPGTGKKIGKIVKISRQGLFCKTWEGELIRGGFSDGSGTLGSSFHFTVENDSMALKCEKFLESQEEVILTYRAEGISSSFRSEDGNPNFLINIEKNR